MSIDPEFSDIIDPEIKRIIVLSDIHGDIDTFIVNLRDNAKVIRKMDGATQVDLNKVRDPELQPFYDLDLNDPKLESEYQDHLNYEWIGENTYVVIVGDILDPYRIGDQDVFNPRNFYIPQMEIKLLRFINAIDDQAIQSGGRIIKVLGNHDVHNLLANHPEDTSNLEFVKTYTFPRDQTDEYFQGYNRLNYFGLDSPGGQLLVRNNAYILLKINHYIFVHANLPAPFTDGTMLSYETINQINWTINHSPIPEALESLRWVCSLGQEPSGQFYWSPIWNRENTAQNIHQRITDATHQEGYCQSLSERKIGLCGSKDSCNPERLQIFVGHCVQAEFSLELQNRTYTTILREDAQTQTLMTRDPTDVYTGPPNPGNNPARPEAFFGITFECPLDPYQDQYIIYRVDVGAGRGQFYKDLGQRMVNGEWDEWGLNLEQFEKLYLLSRAPHIIEIQDSQICITRSKIGNTRIHVPREEYENSVGLRRPLV